MGSHRAFTLLEMTIVIAAIGVMAAIAMPGISEMVQNERAMGVAVENATAMAAVRDNARNRGVCLDYVQSPCFPAKGPYSFTIQQVTCPGDRVDPSLPKVLTVRDVSPTVDAINIRPVFINDLGEETFGSTTDVLHFDRQGSLYRPASVFQVDATINSNEKTYRIYPAAGTVEFREVG